MDFTSNVFTYLDTRGIPNTLNIYLMDRKVEPHFTKDEIVADREIYGFFDSWLTGRAHTYYDQHIASRSGLLVWRDMVENFFARTPQRRAAVGLELKNIEYRPGFSKESAPQFFARLRGYAIKYKAVGGKPDEEDLVTYATTALMAEEGFRHHVSSITEKEDITLFDLETKLVQKLELERMAARNKKKRTGSRAMAHNTEISEHLTNPDTQAMMLQDRKNDPPAKKFLRPWEDRMRKPGDRTGLGSGRTDRSTSNAQGRRNWSSWKGNSRQQALQQLKDDYQAQVAAVQMQFPPV